MYNPEMKYQYLQWYRGQGGKQDIINIAVTAFEVAEKCEIAFGKDLSQFTVSDIDELYSSINRSATSSFATLNWYYIHYTDYCIENNFVKNNEYRKFNITNLSKYVTPVYYEIIDLIKMASELDNSCDKFILLAPFYGFTSNDDFKDITQLTRESFHKNDYSIHLWDGRVISNNIALYTYGINAFDEYYYHQAKGGTNRMVGDGIIKYMPKASSNSPTATGVINSKFNRPFRKKFQDKNLTYNHVRKSGIVFYSNQIIYDESCSDIFELWRNKRFINEVINQYKITSQITNFNYTFGPQLKFITKVI